MFSRHSPRFESSLIEVLHQKPFSMKILVWQSVDALLSLTIFLLLIKKENQELSILFLQLFCKSNLKMKN